LIELKILAGLKKIQTLSWFLILQKKKFGLVVCEELKMREIKFKTTFYLKTKLYNLVQN
jgi:hypothetical protein